jgi:hypothetical protein
MGRHIWPINCYSCPFGRQFHDVSALNMSWTVVFWRDWEKKEMEEMERLSQKMALDRAKKFGDELVTKLKELDQGVKAEPSFPIGKNASQTFAYLFMDFLAEQYVIIQE